uniref:F-box and WD repeat domain containing 8 n=1 Tax=Zosterops lateralis melanops TaxID=1220523 RepID=A0A8D2P4W1_ZOSLA
KETKAAGLGKCQETGDHPALGCLSRLTDYILFFPFQNEINEVPFFDVQLPYELALKIFQYLGKAELGRCAQVSRTWKVLAEDEVLWYRLCQGEGYLCWEFLWVTLPLFFRYTSGEVRLWDTRTWDYTAPVLAAVAGPGGAGAPPHVSFVRINSSLAVAAYEDGTVSVWSLLLGQEPIHHFQHNQHIQALALAPGGSAVATASGFQVRVESPDDRGFWQTPATFEIQKLVNFLNLVPDVTGSPVAVAAAEDIVYLLKAEDPGRILHSVYGQPVTCLDVAAHEAAFGIKTFGWLLNEPNQILLYNLETNQCVTKVGSSIGEFSCVNLHSSPPNMLVAGNKDRRVRVFDVRRGAAACSVYGHQLGVTAVRMDDWKMVSGGEEGLVCVWDQRMATKLWEMHARHPVRLVWFNSHSLITANIPEEKNPRGSSITEDDPSLHRKYRGVIYSYEFSVDQLAVDSVLPICRSSYDELTGYNYNIGLAVPYDSI